MLTWMHPLVLFRGPHAHVLFYMCVFSSVKLCHVCRAVYPLPKSGYRTTPHHGRPCAACCLINKPNPPLLPPPTHLCPWKQLMCFPFWECYMWMESDHVTFGIAFSSLSILLWRYTLVVACVSSSSLLTAEEYFTIWVYCVLFNHLPIEGHLVCY